MKTEIKRLLSLLLVFVMVFQSLPVSAFAATPDDGATIEEPTVMTDSLLTTETCCDESAYRTAMTAGELYVPDHPEIEREVYERRTATEKHFQMADGTYTVASYGYPVHYFEDGIWKDYDNTLFLSQNTGDAEVMGTGGTQTAPACYMTESGDLTRSFITDTDGRELYSVEADGSRFSFGLPTETEQATLYAAEDDPVETSVGTGELIPAPMEPITPVRMLQATPIPMDPGDGNDLYAAMIPNAVGARLAYEDVWPGVDLVYEMYGPNLKENIVLSAPLDDYRFTFTLSLDGLTPKLTEDGALVFRNSEGAPVWECPAPYMFDGMGAVSQNVRYELMAAANGKCYLTIVADPDWISSTERIWPVTIDPTIVKLVTTGLDNEPISTTYVQEGFPNMSHPEHQTAYFGWSSYNGEGRVTGLAHINTLPGIPYGGVMTGAHIQYYYHTYSGVGMPDPKIGVREIISGEKDPDKTYPDWLKDLTWNTKPSTAPDILDYAVMSQSKVNSWISWDITRAVKKWYNDPETNLGLAFDLTNVDQCSASMCAVPHVYTYHSTYSPILTVQYRDTIGIESYYSYQTLGAGRAGTAYVGDYTGQITLIKTDASVYSPAIPVTVSHVYNSAYATERPREVRGTGMYFGFGWKLDAIQTVAEKNISGIEYAVYTDGDGTQHWFQKDSGSGLYQDEDGLGLTLTKSSTTPLTYRITNDSGDSMTFVNGVLSGKEDAFGNKIFYRYNSGDHAPTGTSADRLESIVVCQAGSSTPYTVAAFTYGASNGYLSKITDYSGNVTHFSYSTGKLATVTHPDGTTVSYTYTADTGGNKYKISSATDNESEYKLSFTFASNGTVSAWSESDGTVTGASVAVKERTARNVEYKITGQTSDALNRHVIYLFDFAGRTVNSYAKNPDNSLVYAASAGTYTANSGVSRLTNHLLAQTSSGRVSSNLLNNGSAENGTANWTATTVAGVTAGATTLRKHTGEKALYFTNPNNVEGTVQYQIGTPALTNGQVYTFSAYVNTAHALAFNGEGIYLSAQNGTKELKSLQISHATSTGIDGGWLRLSVSFTAEAGTKLFICCDQIKGTVYMDDAQLEIGDAMSGMDLMKNGSADGTYGWTLVNGTVGSASGITNKAIAVSSTPDTNAEASQEIHVSLPATETFVFSGWANAVSVPDNTDDGSKTFGLRAVVSYTDGTTETHYQPFHSDVTDWQYTSLMIVPKAPEKTVDSVRVSCVYAYNNGTAWFDNLSFSRQVAQTYTYDENGDLVQVGVGETEDLAYAFNSSHEITSFTDRTGVTYSYTYGDYHNVTSVTDGTTTASLTYDERGNITGTTLSGGNATVITSAAYSGGSNYLLTRETNSNGQSITYDYSGSIAKQYGLPTTTTTPDGTSTTTSYSGTNGRVTQVGVANYATLGYTYSAGELTKILRQSIRNGATFSQTYNMVYGSFGDLASVSVGNRPLASYTYNIRTGAVEKMTYGNGDYVEYGYDNLDRLVEVQYNGVTRLTYRYTGEGRLHMIQDHLLKTTEVYTYDSLGRLIYAADKEGLYQSHSYDTANRPTAYVRGGSWIPVRTQTYSYNDRGLLSSVNLGNGTSQSYAYDGLGRVTQIAGDRGTITYGYAAPSGTAGTTTALISDLTITRDGNTLLDLNYTYDSMGRISGDGTYTYSYDALGQLTTVRNTAGTTVAAYTYDGAGNILSATENGTTSTYTYGDSNWPDLLTAYNGAAITYDEIGNPTSYRGYTMTWENGRQLASMSSGEQTVSFTYDANGLRSTKTVGGSTTEYLYCGTQLAGMRKGQQIAEFFYRADGKPYAALYSGDGGTTQAIYYYLLNLQGDIVGMTNASGTVIVRYTYDPWGKVTSVTNSSGAAITSATHFANVNPLRYRGYIYDTESGLYYLQSRYYDPEVGRFINADQFASTGQGIIGQNMFAYCNNDPISFADVSGNMRTYSVMMTDSMCRSYCEIQSLRLNNENEHIVLSADTFAFYKGTLVAKIPFMDDNAFSYGIIFLGSNVTSTETLKHEYGHSVHMDQIGVLSYTVNVFIPSLIGFWSGVPYDEYYSQAYEYVADMLGGVERTLYGQPYKYSITNVEASFYYLYTLLFP